MRNDTAGTNSPFCSTFQSTFYLSFIFFFLLFVLAYNLFSFYFDKNNLTKKKTETENSRLNSPYFLHWGKLCVSLYRKLDKVFGTTYETF